MTANTTTPSIAFAGPRRIAAGPLGQVALAVKAAVDQGETLPILVFDDATSAPIELDLRGSAADVEARLVAPAPAEPAPARGRGRPKLGVVAREVTLLPRHWDWLNGQPGGASVALRKLVEEAARANRGRDAKRRAQEAAYKFMAAMAGNEAGFERATSALFADDVERFAQLTEAWPEAVRDHAHKLAARAFDADAEAAA